MLITAEIIAIGDELLYGQTLDTNSHWISGQLDAVNIKIIRRTTIGDNETEILTAFAEAEKRANIILITGGLGPTSDDLTKPLLAKYFGVGMQMNEEALAEITELFTRMGRQVTELNRLQAELPENCIKITNRLGTAPGMWFDVRDRVWVSMPGVPYEMKAMMSERIIPKLLERFKTGTIHHQLIRTIGIPESSLAALIEPWEKALPTQVKIAYLPSPGQVKLRLTATGGSKSELEQIIRLQIEKLMPLAGKYIYGYDQEEIQSAVGKLLNSRQATIATAESCTGGYLSHLITSVPGSSTYFMGGVIAYDNAVKVRELGVSEEILATHGAVSEATAMAMAAGIRKKFGTTVGLATTGIAGPDGGSEEKPVGTIWLGYSDEHITLAKKMQYTKDRVLNIQLSAMAALNMVRLNFKDN